MAKLYLEFIIRVEVDPDAHSIDSIHERLFESLLYDSTILHREVINLDAELRRT